MQNAIKRAFTTAVAATTIAWSVAASFAFAPVASAAVASGDLVKGSLPAVYYIGSDMKRYVFTSDKAYKTWYADFSSVKTISDTELASITIGGNVTYKPGVKMVKIQSDPKVYAVAHGGVLRWVSTEAAAVALYGSDWNKKIDDISDAFFTNYTVGAQISSASDYTVANEQSMSPSINADKGLSGGGALNITLASDNPASATTTKNAQGISLLKLNITGTGTVTGFTFTRQGAGKSTDWANIYLYDGDTRLTTGRSVSSSTNQVVFSNLNVAVSGTKVLTLVGDLDGTNSTTGDANSFALVAATDVVAGTTVGGTFPVSGNAFTVSGSTGGSITIAAGSTPSNPKLGQTAVELASLKLTAGATEDVSVRRLVITNSGAAQLANIPNLAITTGGTVVAQNPIISGSTATFVFAVPYVLGKGITRTFSVVGDIAAGNRAGVDTVKLYVDQTYDLYATGNTYGAGVGVTDNFTASSATTLTIQGGQITFAFNGPSTGDVSVGANDAVLAKFAITSVNHVEVRDLRMRLVASSDLAATSGGTSITSITDCKVKNTDNGSTVTNTVDLSGWTDSGAHTTFTKTFTDRFEIAAGQTMNLALTCDVLSTAPAGLSGISLTGTVDARVAGDIRNLDSNLDVAVTDIVPSSALSGNPQTIRSSGLTVALASSPSSQTVTKGSTVNALGVNFTAGSSSDIKVSQIKIRGFISIDGTTTYGATSTGTGTDTTSHSVQDVITSATIWDGTTQLGTAQSPDSNGDMNFTNLAWNIPAGTTKTVTVSVLLSNNVPYGSSANKFIVDLIGDGTAASTTANVTAQDKDSNNVSASNTSAFSTTDFHLQQGGTVSSATSLVSNANTIIVTGIRSGSLTVSIDGDTPVSAIVTANTTDNSVTRVKFSSLNEGFNVTRLTVQNMTSTYNRSITSVRLFDKNGTLFCSGALDSNSRLRCANDAGLFTVANDNVVTIKTNIDQVGSGGTRANSGDQPKLAVVVPASTDPNNVYTDDIKIIGVSSGTALLDSDVGGGSLTVTDNLTAGKLSAVTATAVTGTFTIGETLTGGTSAATARLVAVNVVGANTVFTIDTVSGTFTVGGEVVTGGTSGATFTTTAGITASVIVGVQGNLQVVRKTQPTVATIASSTTLTTTPTLYKFSVTAASNSDVALKRFNVSTSNVLGAGATIGSLRLYENDVLLDSTLYRICTGGNANADVLTCTTDLYAAGTIAANTPATVMVYFNTERLVSAGTTKTYRIDASVSAVAAGNSISSKLLDDASASVVTLSLTNAGLNSANFVWSDNSADTHSAVHASPSSDWTNGKFVKTLPTNPQTLSL